jgi:acetoin utilization deacetylase AcuC-like enzyme
MKNTTAIVADSAYVDHLTGRGHPEQPLRINAIEQALTRAGLLVEQNRVIPRLATNEELLLCHSADYIEKVKEEVANIVSYNLPDDGSVSLSTGDVMICSKSLNIALLAVGGVLTAIDLVMSGRFQNAFCMVRPPGHHASAEQGKGFCIFNNVAIGARYVQKKYRIQKVLIADWDVHHGDGTQAIFEEDPTVFYFSTHRYGYGFYPGTGGRDETGKGLGKGTILNCPIIPSPRIAPRDAILNGFETQLPKAMEAFRPDIVLISAGFDAHEKDPLGGFDLQDADFATLTQIVRQIADIYAQGRMISVLEGGYSLEGLASATRAHVEALL